ncbi:MAG: DUF937 domain-containing protein [Gammaproteobacteria bacterium]|nr:DUF937 domain-containing protein [Gammaproteobacteria bacterium]
MDIMKLATQMLQSKLGANADSQQVESALGGLLGNAQQGGIDLGGLVGGLKNSGLGDIAESWLGDGANENISRSQIEDLLGSDKIKQAASQLGTDQNDLLKGLQDLIPQVVDKSSSGGNLLDSVGGLGGLAGLAGKFLK